MFSHQQVFALAALASSISMVFAAEVTELPTTVITAARLPQPEREVVGDVSIIDSEELKAKHGSSLLDVLASQPGVQISSNGGAGKSGNLFLRGANANQTIVLINGIRYGSATVGSAALQHIPIEQIDRIEILRGPAASLYGSDAIGGVIQIFTRQGSKTPHASIEAGGGSHGQRLINANYGASAGDTRYAIGIAHTATDGISAISNPGKKNYYNPDRDGYENSSLSFSASQKIAAGHEAGINLLATRALNQYDGYSSIPYDTRDKGYNGAASLWSNSQWTSAWSSQIKAGTSIDDSENLSSSGETRFKTRQTQASWLNNIDIGNDTVTLGAETLRQKISGTTAYALDHRDIHSLLGGYLLRLDEWTIQANARHDRNSQFDTHNSGQIGASWQILPAWQIGGSLGSGFRAPTFNELYYPDYGNANLKPEESVSREIFVRYQKAAWQGSLTAYRNSVSNLIQSVLVNPATYTYAAENVGSATLQGITLQAGWQGKVFNAGGSYDWLDARDSSGSDTDGKRLARRARHSGTLYVGAKQGPWQARAELEAHGDRFDDAANNNRLGGYTLVNLSAGWQAAKNWRVEAKLNNLFDKHYELAQNYGTEGLNGLVLLRWTM